MLSQDTSATTKLGNDECPRQSRTGPAEDPHATHLPGPSDANTFVGPSDPAPSLDSILTRRPSSVPETRPDLGPEPWTLDGSIPTRTPGDLFANLDTALDLRPSGSIAGYEMIELLGEGGMGVVWKARQIKLNRTVALKMVLGADRAGARELIRFLAEAEAVAAITHPNVVQVFEYGDAAGRPYLAMEYLPGGSLTDRLKRDRRLEPMAAADLVRSLAEAVQAAHDLGIVHRDLKPGNVLFDEQGRPRVTDFGLAKRAGGGDLTATQAVMGTPAYMAPEQARGDTKFVGPQADVYSLGVILYEGLTGSRPFDDASQMDLLRMVMEEPPDRPGKRVPGLPRDIELICLKCLEKDPAERYPTAGALAADLRRFAAGEPVSVRAAGVVERAAKWARRKPTLAAAYTLGLLALLLATLGGAALWEWRAAETARAEAERQRERFERSEYGRTIEVAHQEWKDNNIATTSALLEGTRADLRGWEWRYVERLCHPELFLLKGHTAKVNSASYSPDGSRIITASEDGTAKVWDARNGAELLSLKGHYGMVNTASFSPDGSQIVTTGQEDTVRVWDAESGAALILLKGGDRFASFSPDGSRIVTGSQDTVKVWDARSGAELLTYKGHAEGVSTAIFSPDGSRIASGSFDEKKVWDARNGAEILAIKGLAANLRLTSFSADALRIVASGWNADVKVWDARNGVEILTLKVEGGVQPASFSPDGSRIITTGWKKPATVWDSRSGAEILSLKEAVTNGFLASFSPDGSRILTPAGDNQAKVWDAKTGAEILTLKGHARKITSASFSPDGLRILTVSEDSTVRIWDANGESEFLTRQKMLENEPDFPTQQKMLRRQREAEIVTSSTTFPTFMDDPSLLRVVTNSGFERLPRVLDARTKAELFTFKGHRVSSWSFSPDGSRILTRNNDDGLVIVWDARTKAELFTLKGHTLSVNAASFSPDGSRILTAGNDGVAKVWDASNGAELLTLKGHAAAILSALFTADGSRIVTLGLDEVKTWDARNGTVLLALNHTGQVQSVWFSNDGSRIFTTHTDFAGGYTAKVWDARSGAELLSLKGHTDSIRWVVLSPDGSRIFTGSQDGSMKVWDAKSGAELLSLKELPDAGARISFSPDGSRIISRSDTVSKVSMGESPYTIVENPIIKIWDATPMPGEYTPGGSAPMSGGLK